MDSIAAKNLADQIVRSRAAILASRRSIARSRDLIRISQRLIARPQPRPFALLEPDSLSSDRRAAMVKRWAEFMDPNRIRPDVRDAARSEGASAGRRRGDRFSL